MKPLINILIRVSRLELFNRCIDTVINQTYENVRVICHCDTLVVYEYLMNSRPYWDKKIEVVFCSLTTVEYGEIPLYYWNLYCNTLKDKVESGWFFYMDDDDYLVDNQALERLANHLTDDTQGLIVQFLRNGNPKPNDALIGFRVIKRGLIGGGCLVLHSRHKDVADWKAKEAADFDWIYAVSKVVPLKFVPLVVQVAGNNGLHGRIDTDPGSCTRGGIKEAGASCSFNNRCTYPDCKPK